MKLLLLTVVFVVFLLLTITLIYGSAFAQPSSSSSSDLASQMLRNLGVNQTTTTGGQQPAPSGPLPKPTAISPCSQMQPLIQKGPNTSIGVIADGSINSVLNLLKGLKYIANGNWHIVDDGTKANFNVDMTWYPNTSTNSTEAKVHTHAIQNFVLLPGQSIKVSPNNIAIKGCADVLTNSKVAWHKIPVSIKIVGNTIDISFTGKDQESILARNHFANQDTTGVVNSISECSDQPQPNMLVLPECNVAFSAVSNSTSGTISGDGNNVIPFIISNG